MGSVRDKVLAAIAETKKNLYEREELANLIWKTIGADLNLLMLGDPGTAKTMIAHNLTKVIKDAKIFKYTLNSFTTIDELFGNFDLIELKNNNRLKRNIHNKLLDCDVAYLDEFFKCNSGTLNALLEVMNEKTFTDSYETVKVPLKFLISSSNELPSDEDNLDAVLDRFQVKYLVKSIQDVSVRINSYQSIGSGLAPINNVISIEEVDEYRREVENVKYSAEVAEMTEKIYQSLIKESVFISDRTLFRTISLIKANAYLDGRDEVESKDLLILKDALWSDVSQQKVVKKVIYDLADPISGKIEEIWEAINETVDKTLKEMANSKDANAQTTKSFELIKKLKHAKSEIEKHTKTMQKMQLSTDDAIAKTKALDARISEVFDNSSIKI